MCMSGRVLPAACNQKKKTEKKKEERKKENSQVIENQWSAGEVTQAALGKMMDTLHYIVAAEPGNFTPGTAVTLFR